MFVFVKLTLTPFLGDKVMKIQLTLDQMHALLESGVLHPSDIDCLDLDTRNQLKALCLKMCQPTNCARCQMHELCQTSVKPANSSPLSVKQAPRIELRLDVLN